MFHSYHWEPQPSFSGFISPIFLGLKTFNFRVFQGVRWRGKVETHPLWVFPQFSGIRHGNPNVTCWNIWKANALHFRMNKTSLERRQTKTPRSPAWSSKSYTRVNVPSHMLVKGFQFPFFDVLWKVGRVTVVVFPHAHQNINPWSQLYTEYCSGNQLGACIILTHPNVT